MLPFPMPCSFGSARWTFKAWASSNGWPNLRENGFLRWLRGCVKRWCFMNGLNWIIHGFFIHGFLFMNPIIDVRRCFTSVQIGKFHILCSFSYLNLSDQERTFVKNENEWICMANKAGELHILGQNLLLCYGILHCGTLKIAIVIKRHHHLSLTYRLQENNMYAVLHRYRNQESTSWRPWNVSSSTHVGRMPPQKRIIYTLPETKIAPENGWLEY